MDSILGRFRFLLFAFFLLIVVSVSVTIWGLKAQAEGALLINLAGRQRMLVQQMTRLATAGFGEGKIRGKDREALLFAIADFNETHQALQYGGITHYPLEEVVELPALRDPSVLQSLGRVAEIWEVYRADLDTLLEDSTPGAHLSAYSRIQQRSVEFSAETDVTVRLIQMEADRSSAILLGVQAVFLVCAIGLLAAGRHTFQHMIHAPLKRLNRSAGRIRAGDLQTPVEISGPDEIHSLANDFEAMRAALQKSQQQLVGWAQELEERVEQRTEELDALYEVGRDISSRLDLGYVLQSITGKARELLKAETSFLCLLDAERHFLNLQAISGPAHAVEATSSPTHNPFVQEVLSEPGRQPNGRRTCQGTCGIMTAPYRSSHEVVPLCLENRMIGALCVGHRQEAAFTEEHTRLLERMGSAAAVALENARLYEHAERIAALEERQRIAAAIHDGLAQIVDSMGLLVDQASAALESGKPEPALTTLQRVRERITQASTEVRKSITNLQDDTSQPKSLHEQLKGLIHQISSEYGPVRWDIELDRSLALPKEDAQQVMGIAQETLSNALRHSAASLIRVRLYPSETDAHLVIEDNGCGFDPAAGHTDGRKHFGLKILAARAARLGGSLEVHSVPGEGTSVSLTWPIRKPVLPPLDVDRGPYVPDSYPTG